MRQLHYVCIGQHWKALGPLPNADYSDLEGTSPSISTTELTEGSKSPFDGPGYGSVMISDTSMSTTVVEGLKQGISYFARVSESNALGEGHAINPKDGAFLEVQQHLAVACWEEENESDFRIQF